MKGICLDILQLPLSLFLLLPMENYFCYSLIYFSGNYLGKYKQMQIYIYIFLHKIWYIIYTALHLLIFIYYILEVLLY